MGVTLELLDGFVGLFLPSDLLKDAVPLHILTVRMLEPDRSVGKDLPNRLLLTTKGERTGENALHIARWYDSKWLIE